jgi:hypothetical protein
VAGIGWREVAVIVVVAIVVIVVVRMRNTRG